VTQYAPISRLVDEILIEIWSYLDLSNRFAVSQVCFRWRIVGLGATKLWNEVNVELFSINKLRHLIGRSGAAPLRITTNTKRLDALRWTRGDFRAASARLHGQLHSPYDEHKSSPKNRLAVAPHFFPQSEFNAIVGRAEYLNAVIGTNNAYYVTPETLKIPMPYLTTLKLVEDSRTIAFGPTAPSIASSRAEREESLLANDGWFFGGVSPQLREISFDYIHAAWEDPLYANLTRLRLGHPSIRCSLFEMLVILKKCPKLEELELVEALTGSLFAANKQPPDVEPYNGPDSVRVHVVLDKMAEGKPISLPHLRHLNIDDTDAYGMSHLLTCIELPPLRVLSLHTPDSSCLTDQHARGKAFESLIPTISNTKNLQVTGGMSHLAATGTTRTEGSWPTKSGKGVWSYLCRPRARTTHYNHTLGQPGPQVPLAYPPLGTLFGLGHHVPPFPAIAHHVYNHTSAYSQYPASTGICDPLQFLHQADLSGVNYAGIERLELGGTLDDIFYRDILARCANVKHLRLMSHRGINIVAEIIGINLCKQLQEIQIFKFDSSAHVLAEWVEARANHGLGLKRVFVQVTDTAGTAGNVAVGATPASNLLDTLSKARMENALGVRGLVWKNPPRSMFGTSTPWVDMIEDGTVDWERGQLSNDIMHSMGLDGDSDMELEDWFGDGVFPPNVW
jgi:hypothetical protein